MTPEVLWIFSGFGSLGLLGLGGMWREIKTLNKNVTHIAIRQAKHETRLDSNDKLMDKIPCINNRVCINKR